MSQALRVRVGAVRVALERLAGEQGKHATKSRVQSAAIQEIIKRSISLYSAEDKADLVKLITDVQWAIGDDTAILSLFKDSVTSAPLRT